MSDADNKLRAIKILEGLQERGTIRPDEQKTLESLRAEMQSLEMDSGRTRAAYQGFGQGVTLGLSDEIVGAVQGKDAREQMRDDLAYSQQMFPSEYRTGQFTGGAATSALPFGATMSAARGAPMLMQTLAGAGTGAGIAAFEGAATANPPPDANAMETVNARREGAVSDPAGLGIGAAVGAAAPWIGRGIGGAIGMGTARSARHMAREGVGGTAGRMLSRSFRDDAALMDDAAGYLQGLGDEGMIADLGRNTRMQARGVASVPGPGGQRLAKAVDDRGDAAAQRVRGDLDNVTVAAGDEAAARATRKADRTAQASPLYEAAKAIPDPLDMTEAKGVFDGLISDRSPGSARLKSALNDITEDPRPIVIHNTRVDLDDARREAIRAGRNGEAITLGKAVEKLDEQLDTLPGYADARKTWADSKALDDAAEAGSTFLSNKVRPDQFRMDWDRMSDPEKEAFRSAARDALEFEMGKAVNENRRGVDMLGPTNTRAKLETIFGKDAADALSQRLDAERVFRETRGKIAGGSDTAATEAAKREIGPIVDETGNRLTPVQRAKNLLYEPLNNAVDSVVRPGRGQLDVLAEGLTRQGPRRDALVQAIMADAPQLAKADNRAAISKRLLEALIQSAGGGVAVSRPD